MKAVQGGKVEICSEVNEVREMREVRDVER